MQKLLILLLAFSSVSALANFDSESSWKKADSYRNEMGEIITEVVTLNLYNDGCSAYSETFEGEIAVTGGKLDCYYKNNFVKISSWGSIIAQGYVSIQGYFLILTYKSRAYNRTRDEEKVFFTKVE